jgi:hypothetical protein
MNVLKPDFDSYKLIAIHTKLEDYKLAYLINSALGSGLKRHKESLDFKNSGASFSVFEHLDKQTLFNQHLIQNKVLHQSEDPDQGSFFKEFFKKTHCLVNEKKEVDFFLRVEDCDEKYLSKVIGVLKMLEGIIFSYSLQISGLKSRNNLIF